MIEELKKSINSSLYEKTRSPLYGTLIISLVVWNWKVVYYILTVSNEESVFSRIDCINGLTNHWTLYLGPLISTLLFLIVFEWIANYAYWLSIFYKTWRINKKHLTEGKQLITYEQSLKLRNDIRKSEESFEKLLQEKELEIKGLKDYLRKIESENETYKINKTMREIQKTDIIDGNNPETTAKKSEIENLLDKIYANKNLSDKLEDMYRSTQQGLVFQNQKINQELIDFAVLNDLIIKHPSSAYGYFNLTEKGKQLMKLHFEKKL